MLRRSTRQVESPSTGRSAGGPRSDRGVSFMRAAAVLTGLTLLLQPACLFKKHKAAAPPVPPASVRIVYLPLNISGENTDLRWLSLAVPAMMAKVSESAPDLETVPLWEAMPVAVEAAGNSRSFTPETAAYVASRLSAKWATEGDLRPAKGGVQVTVDFIPARTTLVPFRYESQASIDSLGNHFADAFDQFLRYLVVRPMIKGANTNINLKSLRQVVDALDREYGWFVTANPGKSDKVVADLSHSDGRLARLLFNPGLYPGMAAEPSASPKVSRPAASTDVEKGNARPAPPGPSAQSRAPAASPEASRYSEGSRSPAPRAENADARNPEPAKTESPLPPQPPVAPSRPVSQSTFVPPPPRSFSQRLESALPAIAVTPPVAMSRRPKTKGTTFPSSAAGARQSITVQTGSSTGSKRTLPAMNKASPEPRGADFKVQIGAERSKAVADTIAGRLAKDGLASEVVMADLKEKGIWYRIRLHGYDSRTAAEAAGKKLLAEKVIEQYWVVR